MSKRKKIFHKPEEQVPSAEDILNYLNEEISPVPPAPQKSAPSRSAESKKKRKKEAADESLQDLSLSKEEEKANDDRIFPASEISLEMSSSFEGLSTAGGGINSKNRNKNKKKYELEKSMLSEPLVSEAVEGYALLGDRKKARNLIEEINQNISVQTRKKNNRAVVMRIAAILLVIFMVSGGSFYLFDQLSEERMTAISNEKSSPSSNMAMDTVFATDEDLTPQKQLAIETETPGVNSITEDQHTINSKPIPSDAYINKEQSNYGPVSEQAAKGNAFNSNILSSVNEQEESQNKLVSPIVSDEIQADSVVIYYKDKADQFAMNELDDSKEEGRLDRTERKKTSAENTNAKKTKQKGNADYAPAVTRAQSELSKEENKPSGVLTKTYLLEDGIRLYNEERYTEAKEIFTGLLLTQPSNQEAIFYSGMSDYKIKKYAGALSNLSKVIPASRRYDEARWNMAIIYLETENKEEAKKLLNELSRKGNSYAEKALEELKKLE